VSVLAVTPDAPAKATARPIAIGTHSHFFLICPPLVLVVG
jgi:hypothetical protein